MAKGVERAIATYVRSEPILFSDHGVGRRPVNNREALMKAMVLVTSVCPYPGLLTTYWPRLTSPLAVNIKTAATSIEPPAVHQASV